MLFDFYWVAASSLRDGDGCNAKIMVLRFQNLLTNSTRTPGATRYVNLLDFDAQKF
jgi:hypothetical protein